MTPIGQKSRRGSSRPISGGSSRPISSGSSRPSSGGSSRPSSARSRILPNSTADVEAALAAVRLRTAKLKLQSAENDFENIRPSSVEKRQRRQPSHRGGGTKPREGVLDASTLQSVSDYIGKLNSEHTGGTVVTKTQNIETYDDSDDSSDDSYGVTGVNLQDISAMIDRVHQKKTPTNATSTQTVNQMKAVEISYSTDSSDEGSPDQNDLDLINAMIDKVHTSKVETFVPAVTQKESAPVIQSSTSSTSSDYLSDDGQNVSVAARANLALYIDSLKNNSQPKELPKTSVPLSQDEGLKASTQHSSTEEKSVLLSNKASGNKINGNLHRVNIPNSVKSELSQIRSSTSQNHQQHIAQHQPEQDKVQRKPGLSTSPTQTTVLLSSREESIMQRVPAFDNAKLLSYIDKAKEIARKTSPTIEEVEYIIIYARRDKVPIVPILRALVNCCKDARNKHEADNDSQTKELLNIALTVSSDGDLLDLDDDVFDVFLNDEMEELTSAIHRKIARFAYFINEAVHQVENNILNYDEIQDLADRAANENFDDALLRQILQNPKVHVKYVKVGKDDPGVELTVDFDKSESNRANLNLSEKVLLGSNNSFNFDAKNEETGYKHAHYGEMEELTDNQNVTKKVDQYNHNDEEVALQTSTGSDVQSGESTTDGQSNNNIEGVNDSDEYDEEESMRSNQNESQSHQGNDNKSVFDNSNNSETSSVPWVPSRPGTANTIPFVAALNYTASQSETDKSPTEAKSDDVEDINLLVNSTSSDIKNLKQCEKYLYYKVKEFERAKKLATAKKFWIDGTWKYTAPPLNSVAATKRLFSRRMFKCSRSATPYRSIEQWKMLPNERIIDRQGYKEIHIESYHESTRINKENDPIDELSWEKRDVKQFFIHEADITRANWFGKLNEAAHV